MMIIVYLLLQVIGQTQGIICVPPLYILVTSAGLQTQTQQIYLGFLVTTSPRLVWA